jgi:hypothetical protein
VRRSAFFTCLMVCLVPVSAAGCGDDKKDDSPAKAGQSAEGPAPQQLVGEYSMTLKTADLPPDPPPELTEGSKKWTLKIANTGGPGNGPALTIVNDELGALESSHLGVAGQRLVLHDEECAATGEPVQSEYSWAVSGKTLTLTGAKGGCPDKVAATLLTANAWTRTR